MDAKNTSSLLWNTLEHHQSQQEADHHNYQVDGTWTTILEPSKLICGAYASLFSICAVSTTT